MNRYVRLAAFAAAVSFATAAQAVTVTLEDITLGDSADIETSAPGFGDSGPVSLNWNPASNGNTALLYWNGNYSGRNGAWCSSGSGCLLDILVSSGSSVTFNSFFLGGYANTNRVIGYTVTDLANNLVVASGVPLVSGATGLTANVGATSNTGFRLSFGPDGYNGGINDISYSFGSAVVPEPMSWMVMILGFGAIGAGMRRRAQTATRIAYA